MKSTKSWPDFAREIQNIGLPLLLLIYLVIALAHATLAPLTTGPDELAHYEYVSFIAEHGRLPLDSAERAQASYKSDQPPLYHLLTAIPAAWVDPTGPPFLKRVSDSPRRQLIERTRHAWGLYNTEDEQWPYRAEVLRWQVGRWVAILFGAATVAMTYCIARDVFEGCWGAEEQGSSEAETLKSRNLQSKIQNPKSLALAAAAIVAFTPRFALTGSMLNYETLLAFCSALFLWVLVRLTQAQPSRTTHYAPRTMFLGLLAGLAITAKLSALILPLEIVIGLWLIKRSQGWFWPVYWRGVTMAALGTLVGVSWWFGFTLYQFNTVAADGWWTGLLRPLIAADTSDATTNRLLSFLTDGQAGFSEAIDGLDSGPPWQWAATLFRTFWTVGIEGVQPLGWVGLAVAVLLCGLAGWGLVIGHSSFVSGQNQTLRATHYALPSSHLILSLLLLHLLFPFLLPLLRYAATFSLADTAQGRHVLFIAAPAFAILLVTGHWSLVTGQLFPRTTHHAPRTTFHVVGPTGLRFLAFFTPFFLLLWTLTQLWTMTWAYLPSLPVQTGPAAKAQVSHPLDLALNDTMTLVGYDYQLEAEVLRLDLLWQATAVSPVDYLTEINLVDQQSQLSRQWLGYPAQGRYPTRAWDVGDLVRDTIRLPLVGLPPDDYHLSLDLIATTLNPPDSAPARLSNRLALTEITIPELPNYQPTGQTLPMTNYQIWQNGQPLPPLATSRYRETLLVTDPALPGNPERRLEIVDPTGQMFAPIRQVGNSVLFIVGPDWPTGDYHLQVSGADEPPIPNATFRVIDRWERQFAEPPIAQRVEANFANRVKLLGYDLGTNRAQPGGAIPLTLYWQALDWMGSDYTIFSKLIAADGSVHGGRDRLPREGYSTLYWAPGEIISDPFGLPVDADAPPGVYTIHLGLYQQVGEQALSLPLVQDGRPLDATSLTIGPLKIGQAATKFSQTEATPQTRLNQPFGPDSNLTLLGFDQLPITNYQLPLILYWRTDSPLPLDYTTFVHLRDAAGNVVAQKDQPPLNGAYPTSLWDPGEIIADEIIVPLPTGLAAGTYHVVIGMYDFQTGQRLTVPGQPDNELNLTNLEFAP